MPSSATRPRSAGLAAVPPTLRSTVARPAAFIPSSAGLRSAASNEPTAKRSSACGALSPALPEIVRVVGGAGGKSSRGISASVSRSRKTFPFSTLSGAGERSSSVRP